MRFALIVIWVSRDFQTRGPPLKSDRRRVSLGAPSALLTCALLADGHCGASVQCWGLRGRRLQLRGSQGDFDPVAQWDFDGCVPKFRVANVVQIGLQHFGEEVEIVRNNDGSRTEAWFD
jgi:hypothetical protein